MSHVYISYKSEDGDLAAELVHQIEDAGFQVWTDNERLRSTERWRESIDQAIRDAFVVIVILTPASRASEQIMYEWMFALGVGVRLIPIMRQATELHPRLEAIPTLDFSSPGAFPWGKLLRQLHEARDTGRRPFSPFGAPRSERPAPPPFLQRNNSPAPSSFLDRIRRREQTDDDDDDLDDLPGLPSSTLSGSESPDVAKLIASLDEDERDTKISAARKLGDLGDRSAIPALIKVLRDEDWRVRDAAAAALGKLKAASAVVGLLETLRQSRPGPFGIGSNNSAITSAIREIGDSAVPVLIDALEDEDWRIRLYAVEALGQIGNNEILPALSVALRDPEWKVRWRAADLLGKLGKEGVVPDLLSLLRDDNKDVRISVAWALGRIGCDSAVPGLLRMLQDRDWRVRWAGAEALWAIGPEAIPPLLDLLHKEKKSDSLRRVAIRTLAEIGAPAIENLLSLLHDADWDMRWVASAALQEMGDCAVPALTRALADDDWQVCWAAAEALKQIGTPAALIAVEKWRGERCPEEPAPAHEERIDAD